MSAEPAPLAAAEWADLLTEAETAALEAESEAAAVVDPIARHDLAYITPAIVQRAADWRAGLAESLERAGFTTAEDFLEAVAPLDGPETLSRGRDVPSAGKKPDPLPFRSAADLAATDAATVPWINRPLVAAGAITEVDGRPKAAGKTTFLLELTAAILDGRPFLGEPCAQSPVVYLSEQPAASLRPALARAGLAERDDLRILLWAEARGVPWPAVVAAAVDECRRVGAAVFVVDTLPQWAGIRGDAENNAGAALEAIEPLQIAAARDGLAVVVARHDRKGGGEVGDSGRGSSAYTGAVDIVLQLRRRPNAPRPTIRDLLALSRFDETPDEQVIELTPDGFVQLGSGEAIALEEAKRAIVRALTDSADPLTTAELVDRGAMKESTAREAIGILEAAGYLVRTGKGRRGDPHRFTLTPPATDSVSFPRTLKGPSGETKREPSALDLALDVFGDDLAAPEGVA